jgi:hypothetical protein
MAIKNIRWSQTRPNSCKIYRPNDHKIDHYLPLKDPHKIYPNWDFCFVTTHLATLLSEADSRWPRVEANLASLIGCGRLCSVGGNQIGSTHRKNRRSA